MKIIKEFIAFLKVRKYQYELASLDWEEDTLIYMVNRYDLEKEKDINDLVYADLLKKMLKEELSVDYIKGWKNAVDFRLQLLRNNKHLKETN